MNYQEVIDKYCDDILTGRIPSCLWTRRAVERYKREVADVNCHFVYNAQAAARLLSFTEALKPGDLNGKTLHLLPWQMFVLSQIEGWRYKDEPRRKRYRSAYIEVNRKNGKTTGLLQPLVLYNFLKYKASESYIVSSCKKLSEKTFKEVSAMVRSDKELDRILKCQSLAITFRDVNEHSTLGFRCDGGRSTDGLRPRFFCLDEYHEYTTDKMLSSMTLGMQTKKDAQGVMITTADTDTNRPCYEQHLKARRVLSGMQSQDDFFAIIYALDDSDDYHDRRKWIKANPSLGAFINEDVIASDIIDAELTPHKVPEAKAKIFGIWGAGGERSWIACDVWQRNKDESVDFDTFKGERCYGGLDLAKVDDLCAFTLCFERGGKWYFRHRFYIPQDTVYERYRRENVNFIDWVEHGIITATPGKTTDYDFIIADILKAADDYDVAGIGYDKWQARNVINAIDESRPDIMLIEIEQSLKKLSPLTKDYEKCIKDGLLVDNNPAMLWMMNNVVIKPDVNGNYKPMKASAASNRHIDGVVSSIMAYGVAHNEEVAGGVELTYDRLRALLL